MSHKPKRERPKRRRAREEAARQRQATDFRQKLRRAILGWLICVIGFVACLAMLIYRVKAGLIDEGRNYMGLPTGPNLISICGIVVSIGFAFAIWQNNFGKKESKQNKKGQSPPVNLTDWEKW